MVTYINSVSDSAGVEVTLVFDSDITIIGIRSADASTTGGGIAGTTDAGASHVHGSATG